MPKTVTPQQRFADWLAQLREAAEEPSYTRLLAKNRNSTSVTHRGKLNQTGISDLLNGKFVWPPKLVVVEAFVDACRLCAREDHGEVPPKVARHLGRELWRERHSWLVEALDPIGGRKPTEPAQAAIEKREQAVRDAVGDRPFVESAHHDRYGATRSAFESYHSKVLDRDGELRDLLDAVRGPGAYHVIEGPAFVGKTAFMVELYRRLHAQGCPTVVFYVVDRIANSSQDFLDAGVGQLLTALRSDERIAAPEERATQFTRLWTAFAALGTAECPAVLLVDGLDEQLDAGISPLLPVQVYGHAHVVVATRSLPDFRAAVPRHHAMAARRVSLFSLSLSPHAKAWNDDAKRHLQGWLSSADPDRERIATVLCVAGAPLTRHDLADLLGVSVGRIAQHLHAVERCLLPLAVEATGIGYQWAHATYGQFVDDWVGRGRYTEEIHHVLTWARCHAEKGWPETTPPFLLHGLHHFLRTHAAVAGGNHLVDLVTTARRRRLLETYGHDGVFLETIALAREELNRTGGDSAHDLESHFRLDLNQLTVMSRVHLLPRGLLRLLVQSGLAKQAEGVALAVEERGRAEALAEVSEALVDVGDPVRAREIVDQAWKFTSIPDDPYWQLVAMHACARAARKAGSAISDLPIHAYAGSGDQRVQCALAAYWAEIGDREAACTALDQLLASEQGVERRGFYA
ncbi:hypothetical protein [Streptomyces sp. NBC_00280]|uniref:hypothetical protein n=1 Tax=Streptomyces sp. NBC_00280 TaxID=2975699 RepID=UPI003244C4FD